MKRIAVLALIFFAAGCQKHETSHNKKPRSPVEAKLAGTVQLPNDDGRVYVIESPADDFGFEVNSCMLHVKGNSSSMSCTPPKMKLPESPE